MKLLILKNFFLMKKKEVSIIFGKDKKKIVGKIIGINSSEESQRYVGKLLYLDKKHLPKLKKNQFYFEDLVHMEVLIQKKSSRVGKKCLLSWCR